MGLGKVISDLKEGFVSSGIINEGDIFILKDIDKDINKMRDHIQTYTAFIALVNGAFGQSDQQDTVEIGIGVSGLSTRDDDDYIQVVDKCRYALKKVLLNSSYVLDEDIGDMSITVASEEREDSIMIYVYGDLSYSVKLPYGQY